MTSSSQPAPPAQSALPLVVAGLVLGVFLAALESTVVATAMPTVIRELGGERWYALPFASYLLISTVTSPLWGRASDLLGRRKLYLAGTILFLLGSLGCGVANSMVTLIAGRCIQGLGAGAVTTLTFTMVGELFSMERRARVQGYLSGVWGVAGLVGPLVGGLIVDNASWRWVFYLNLPFGLAGMLLVGTFFKDNVAHRAAKLDLPGAGVLTLGSAVMIWGLEDHVPALVATGVVLFALSLAMEARHPSPIIPLSILKQPLPRASIIGNFLAGAAYFGSVSYLPLFAQGVAQKGAASAGLVLTPMVCGWTLTSIAAARLLPRFGLHRLTAWGFALLIAGFVGFYALALSPLPLIGLSGFFAGSGMGFAMLALFVGTQEVVPKSELGAVTASLLFARSLGGVVGVAAMHPLIGSVTGQSGEELAHGLRRAFLLGLVLVIVASVLVLGRGGTRAAGRQTGA